MAKSKRKKPRKRKSHADRLATAAWDFALCYYHDASNWETHESRMLAAIRRVLREVARG